MFEYKIALGYKITECMNCPFRHEMIRHEGVESNDKLSGVVEIVRRSSDCVLKQEPIMLNELVEGYNSQCPLKGKGVCLPDDKAAQ